MQQIFICYDPKLNALVRQIEDSQGWPTYCETVRIAGGCHDVVQFEKHASIGTHHHGVNEFILIGHWPCADYLLAGITDPEVVMADLRQRREYLTMLYHRPVSLFMAYPVDPNNTEGPWFCIPVK